MQTDFDLLAEVKRYIATATPSQVATDLAASGFGAYHGIGTRILREEAAPDAGLLGLGQAFSTQVVWSYATLQPASILVTPYLQTQMATGLLTKIPAGNYEEMPLAA